MKLLIFSLCGLSLLSPAIAADNTLFRCNAEAVYEAVAGRLVENKQATGMLAMYRNLIVDTRTGLVRYGNQNRPEIFKVVPSKGPPAEGWDIILTTSPNGGDNIWIRAWESPIQFMANLNSLTVFSRTCEVIG